MKPAHSLTLGLVSSAALALVLTACGGGSGGGAGFVPVAVAPPPPPAAPEEPVDDRPTDPVAEAPDTSFDTYYNVCRGTDPKCYNDWGAFATTPDRVLIYSRTAGPRHANLGTPMGTGLNPVMNPDNVMQAGLVRMLKDAGITADWTEDESWTAETPRQQQTPRPQRAPLLDHAAQEAYDDYRNDDDFH